MRHLHLWVLEPFQFRQKTWLNNRRESFFDRGSAAKHVPVFKVHEFVGSHVSSKSLLNRVQVTQKFPPSFSRSVGRDTSVTLANSSIVFQILES